MLSDPFTETHSSVFQAEKRLLVEPLSIHYFWLLEITFLIYVCTKCGDFFKNKYS